MFCLHKKHLTQRNLYTQTAHRSFYRSTFLHAETLPRTVFTQQKLFRTEAFAHKKICTAVFTDRRFLHTESSPHRSFNAQKILHSIFYIQTHLHTHVSIYTDANCTQKLAFTHSQLLHREALLPLLDHLPFVHEVGILMNQPGLNGMTTSRFTSHCSHPSNLKGTAAPSYVSS